MANLPFMLGAAAGIGLIYLFKKSPAKYSKNQHQNTADGANSSCSKQAPKDTERDNLD